MRLFQNLKLNKNDIFDARTQQLRNICSAAIDLVNELSAVDFGVSKIDKKDWEKVIAFDKENNHRYHRDKDLKESSS